MNGFILVLYMTRENGLVKNKSAWTTHN